MEYIKLNEKYSFTEDLLNQINAFEANENQDKEIKKDLLKKAKTEYVNLVKELKIDVKKQIVDIKAKYVGLTNDVESEHQNALQEAKKLPQNDKLEAKKVTELISGINIKAKRAKKNLIKDRLQEEVDAKRALIELRLAYARIHKQIVGKNNIFFDLVTERIEQVNSTCLEKRVRDRDFWLSKVSIFSFSVLLIFYIVTCLSGKQNIEYEKIIQDSSVIIAVALGGVFIYSMRSFDMSLGAGTAVAAAIGGLVWNKSKSIIAVLIVGMIIGIAVELVNSALASVLKLPVMVTTLAMSSVLGAILDNILDAFTKTDSIKVIGTYKLDTFGFYIGVLVIFFLITAFIFKFTPVGRKNKMIGANSTSSRYSGINIMKQGLITFTIAGCAIGVGAMLYIVGSKIVTASSCSTIGLDVILAIVFGGMQTTGGPKSKISAAITGGLSATLITYILIALQNISGGTIPFLHYEALIKGALFLAIVAVNQIGVTTKRLPAIEMLW